jgi:hypothetical protein
MAKLLLKIELIPHAEQRYPTCVDWQVDSDGCICIKVSDTGLRVDALLVGIHEAVEAILCDAHNVLESDVDAFDIEFCKTHDLEKEEPGEDPKAPYRREHAAADVVERIVALQADENWGEYNDRIDALFKKEKN